MTSLYYLNQNAPHVCDRYARFHCTIDWYYRTRHCQFHHIPRALSYQMFQLQKSASPLSFHAQHKHSTSRSIQQNNQHKNRRLFLHSFVFKKKRLAISPYDSQFNCTSEMCLIFYSRIMWNSDRPIVHTHCNGMQINLYWRTTELRWRLRILFQDIGMQWVLIEEIQSKRRVSGESITVFPIISKIFYWVRPVLDARVHCLRHPVAAAVWQPPF